MYVCVRLLALFTLTVRVWLCFYDFILHKNYGGTHRFETHEKYFTKSLSIRAQLLIQWHKTTEPAIFSLSTTRVFLLLNNDPHFIINTQSHNDEHHGETVFGWASDGAGQNAHIRRIIGRECIIGWTTNDSLSDIKIDCDISIHLFYARNHCDWYNRQWPQCRGFHANKIEKTFVQLLFSIFGHIWYGIFVVLLCKCISEIAKCKTKHTQSKIELSINVNIFFFLFFFVI